MRSFSLYGDLSADEARMRPYVKSLRQAVTAGSVVLDLGAGATAFSAILACRFGARRVFAIEVDDTIAVARQVAAANGCGDRIEFTQGDSKTITLPWRADGIISDLHGVLPLHDDATVPLIDARARLLAPGADPVPRPVPGRA